MALAKVIVFTLIAALFSATVLVMDVDAPHGVTGEMSRMDCNACPDAVDHDATPHMGDCANGASCMMAAVTVGQRPVVMDRVVTEWIAVPASITVVSASPTLDLPPPRA
ncbi:hypothetical protein [Maritimibacter dapengensis]|uniref:Uncharacterized protein n=1 Tax=Maritimibacter dapengensis TaxID=2836868 RepID=A0ABS6T362_9RHOB|nr:hypothetical protein [Maritimibacter dapengensis]MBV7379673.1 hypothetical protein [Maritimibacter dapengensis]